jgi:hypothetical protein
MRKGGRNWESGETVRRWDCETLGRWDGDGAGKIIE